MTAADVMTFPTQVMLNAWTGAAPLMAVIDSQGKNWGVKERVKVSQLLKAPEPVDLRNWQHPKVGWALVLPENEQLTPAQRAGAGDAPEPMRELLAARPGSPVLRYRADLQDVFVRRYFADGSFQDLAISTAGERGVGRGELPYYLLIYGSPKAVPWSFHYALQQACFVGRLDLEGAELENYITALIAGWAGAACDPHKPLVWAVDLNPNDISHLMRNSIADKVFAKFELDTDIGAGATRLAAAEATQSALSQALAAQHPALVVTTSHGMTGPLDNPALMAQQLGVLVDNNHVLLDIAQLLDQWQPDGAIWYAHACCSAGSDDKNSYKGLVPAGSDVDLLLDGVAALGAQIAPMPRRLLGARRPLRAFIGHVEPTFDWTLRRPETRQVLTSTTVEALYNHQFGAQPEPVGLAFHGCYLPVGELCQQWRALVNTVTDASDAAARDRIKFILASTQLAALDRQSMVIVGDPTVVLPSLYGAGKIAARRQRGLRVSAVICV